jgi:hypothetical protein
MRSLALLLVMLAGCDPVWGVQVRVQHPGRQPVENATVAVACTEGTFASGSTAVKTTPDGKGWLGGIGHQFPVGCDVYVAKPGYQTHRIRYRDLCPNGPEGCNRYFEFDLVLEPARTARMQ